MKPVYPIDVEVEDVTNTVITVAVKGIIAVAGDNPLVLAAIRKVLQEHLDDFAELYPY